MANPRLLYDNRLDDGTPAASTTAPGFDVLNLRDWRPFTKWQPTAMPATVDVDAVVAKAADYAAICGHNLFTAGIRARFMHSDDDIAYTEAARHSPDNDDYFAVYFTSTSHRYWRILLQYVNVLTRTEEFDHADWTKANASVSADAVGAPDDSLSADTLVEDSTTNLHFANQNIALVDNVDYSFSVYAKPSGRDWLQLRIGNKAGVPSFANFNVNTGTVGTTGGAPLLSTGIEAADNGFYRCNVRADAGTGASTPSQSLFLASADNVTNYLGDGSSGVTLWGAQFESNIVSNPSPYYRVVASNAILPTIGTAAIGEYLEMPEGLSSGFDPSGREPKGVFNRSVGGQPLGRTVQYEEFAESLTFRNVTWAWRRATWEPAWTAHLRSTPFVLDWNPEDATHGDEIRLVTAVAGYSLPHKPGALADLTFDVVGAI